MSLGVFLEERLGGSLDAIGSAAEVDRVEVPLEDLVLALLVLELDRQDRLLDLAPPGALLGEIQDLDVLLGDRRGALRRAAAGVVQRRPDDALQVDPVLEQKERSSAETTASRIYGGISRQRNGLAVLRGERTELLFPSE